MNTQVNKALQTAKRNRTLAKHNQMIRQHDFETKTLELKQQQLTSQLKSMMGVEDIMDFELSDMMQTDPDFIYQDVDIYTIQAGDTLSGIAQNHGTDWQKLFRVNQFSSNIYDPNKILPGQTIIVPKVQRPTTTQRKSLLNPKIINPKITDSSKVVKGKGYQWNPNNTAHKMLEPIMTEPYKTHGAIGSQNILPVINRFGQVEKAYKFWEKQIKHKPPMIIFDKLRQKNLKDINVMKNTPYGKWELQTIDKATGKDVNLDFYSVEIEDLPINPQTNQKYSQQELFEYIRENAVYFFSTDEVTLEPYDKITDGSSWLSNNPLGTVMKFQVGGDSLNPFPFLGGNPDDLTVICTAITSTSWIFTTIQSPEDQQHPVSENREFGIKVQDGKMSFYTQGADRITGFIDLAENYYNPISMNDSIFVLADELWKKVMIKKKTYIYEISDKSKTKYSFSKIFKWSK